MTLSSDSTVEKKTFSAGASFRIAGIGLDMERISNRLGHAATHAHKQGELNQLKEIYETDLWMLTSPLGTDVDLGSHLDWLADILLPHRPYISELGKLYKIDIYCHKTCYTEQASLNLSSQTLRIFTELDLKLGVSLIFLPD